MSDLVKRLRDEYGGNWREVTETNGNYWVSDNGDVYSLPRPKCKGGLIGKTTKVGGYITVSVMINRKPVHMLLHRVVAKAFIGEIPDKIEVRHIDGNPANNNLNNLKFGTKSENESDKKIHGTFLSGERTPSAKLTWDQVCAIRNLKGVVFQKELASKYGIARSTVQRIQSWDYWKVKSSPVVEARK